LLLAVLLFPLPEFPDRPELVLRLPELLPEEPLRFPEFEFDLGICFLFLIVYV